MSDTPLDPRALLAHLGYPAPESAEPVTGGRDTAIWRVRIAGDDYALRVFRPEQAPVVAYEVAAMHAARAGGVPTPEVHATGAWHGRPLMLLEWSEGETIVDALRQHPRRAWALGVESGRTLARIHRVPPPEPARSWRAAPGDVGAALATRLETCSGPDVLLHLDFHPLNLLTDGEHITAVLDWTNTCAGDARADLARTLSILRLETGDLPREERALLRQYERGLRHGYGPVDDLAPFLAWAGAFMLADTAHRLDQASRQRRRIEAWQTRWESRSGVASP